MRTTVVDVAEGVRKLLASDFAIEVEPFFKPNHGTLPRPLSRGQTQRTGLATSVREIRPILRQTLPPRCERLSILLPTVNSVTVVRVVGCRMAICGSATADRPQRNRRPPRAHQARHWARWMPSVSRVREKTHARIDGGERKPVTVGSAARQRRLLTTRQSALHR
jgi:hypothetical protein